MKPKPLTQAERNWLELLEHLLLNPPSKRISFFTIGDQNMVAYDNRFEPEIDRMVGGGHVSDVCCAVDDLGAELFRLHAAMPIHSTAG